MGGWTIIITKEEREPDDKIPPRKLNQLGIGRKLGWDDGRYAGATIESVLKIEERERISSVAGRKGEEVGVKSPSRPTAALAAAQPRRYL